MMIHDCLLAVASLACGAGGYPVMTPLEQERSISASVCFDGANLGGGSDSDFGAATDFAPFKDFFTLSASAPDEGESTASAQQHSWMYDNSFGFFMHASSACSSFTDGSEGSASASFLYRYRFNLSSTAIFVAFVHINYVGQFSESSALLAGPDGLFIPMDADWKNFNLELPAGEYLFEARGSGAVETENSGANDFGVWISGAFNILPAPGAALAPAFASVFMAVRRRRG